MSKNTIEVTDEQLKVINAALELFSRVHTGQFEYVRELFMLRNGVDAPKLQTCEYHLSMAKEAIFGFARHASHGICSRDISIDAQTAYDMLCVFKQHAAIKRDPAPKFRSVDYDSPMHVNTDIALAVIKNA